MDLTPHDNSDDHRRTEPNQENQRHLLPRGSCRTAGFQPAGAWSLVSPICPLQEGGATSSGLRRDAAGRPVDETGDRASEEVNVPISDRSGGARPRRRLRWKQRAQEHPGAALGPEPLLRPEDLAAAEENVQGIEELVPKIHVPR